MYPLANIIENRAEQVARYGFGDDARRLVHLTRIAKRNGYPPEIINHAISAGVARVRLALN